MLEFEWLSSLYVEHIQPDSWADTVAWPKRSVGPGHEAPQHRNGPGGHAVKDSSPGFPGYSRSPFSPSQGEKVAERPDEGVFRDSARQKILHRVARWAFPHSV